MAEGLQPPAEFPFPFPPYDIQKELMREVFLALEHRRLAIFESPTGTGKSLSLICGALSWLHEYNKQRKPRLAAELAACEAAVRSCEDESDWFSAAGARQARAKELCDVKTNLQALAREDARLVALKQRIKQTEQCVEDGKEGRDAKITVDDLYKDAARARDVARRHLTGNEELPAEEQQLLLGDDDEEDETQEEEEEEGCIKIYYCSRTHSQLSQFVGEVQKTVYGGGVTRVVALAARQNLCINPEVTRLRSAALINDRCLELQKKRGGKTTAGCGGDGCGGGAKGKKRSKTSHGCPYKTNVRALADQVLVQVQDLEELVRRGREAKVCPYYAARAAVRDAQLVVVPYASVLQERTRAAVGLRLRGNVLIIDEAHNLLATLAAAQEQSLSYSQVAGSTAQLRAYLHRYEARLSARNLLYVNQLLFCLKSLAAALTPPHTHPSRGKHGNKGPSGLGGPPEDTLLSVATFLSHCLMDNLNLHQLLQYLDTSHLANKLHGFSQLFQGSVTVNSKPLGRPATVPTTDTANNDSSVKSFLLRIAAGRGKATGNKENEQESSSAAAAVTVAAAQTDGDSGGGGGGGFLQVVEFLRRMTSLNTSGRVLVHRGGGGMHEAYVKYVVLDPAEHFHHIVRECRAVILAGGTMKPMAEFRDALFLGAGEAPERLREFSCGHVVPPSHVLPVTIAVGPTGIPLDLTHQRRTDPSVMLEVGRALAGVSRVVPAGVVVFLPSYQYSQQLLTALKKEGVLDTISAKKKVFCEPREAARAGAVLADYAATIRRATVAAAATTANAAAATTGLTGAMLFCVVGGKMSEGINFSDDLGRCVVMVGVPYPNSHAPELRERMRHLDVAAAVAKSGQDKGVEGSSGTRGGGEERGAGAEYYHNLCFRSVNQSIGRVIRHRNDYASIVLLDQRYARPAVVASLPEWIARSLVCHNNFGPAQAALAKFFWGHKRRRQTEEAAATASG